MENNFAGAPRTDRHPVTAPDGDQIFSWIRDLTAFSGRGTQTRDDHRSVDYLLAKFAEFGLTDIQVQETDSLHWYASHSELSVGGTPIAHSPVAFSFDCGDGPFDMANGNGAFSTGPDGITADIVDVGEGQDDDFAAVDVDGKVVMFNLRFLLPRRALLDAGKFVYDPHDTIKPSDLDTANPYLSNFEDVVEKAIAQGAAAFVAVLADYFDSHDIRTEYKPDVAIPGLWVTKTAGAQIRTLNTQGVRAATLRLEGERTATPARTVIGYLAGVSSNTIMIQSHHDSAWEGGVEDASGTAEVLALAQHYSQIPKDQRPKTLMFVLMDSHWTGYQAHQRFVDTFINAPDIPRRIVANVTLEHIAKQAEVGPGGVLQVFDRPEYRGIFENVSPALKTAIDEAVAAHGLERTVRLDADELVPLMGELPTDAEFVFEAGVPTISLISGPLYLYDKADTLDKVHKPDLAPIASAFIDIVNRLAATPGDRIGN
ncbi:M28 family peptidase [Streptomyces hydrogenans]|uniref:M28 family peptidase n=1 Tax=Streptomyces hydrogenans TaxID=1873719 RepID=UPI0036329D2F